MGTKSGKIAFGIAAFALLALFAAFAFASAPQEGTACSATPELALASNSISSVSGRVAELSVAVKGTQSASCGSQTYGMDFTNAYGASRFYLGMENTNSRFLFPLSPGEIKTFTAKIGIPPGLSANNYTLQMTAYSEADHWKQVSGKVAVEVMPPASSDQYWATPIEIGWNAIPHVDGAAVFGCQNITYAYRYSPTIESYVKMNRFGAEFADEKNMAKDAQLSGLFVFSKQKCALQSLVPNEKLNASMLDIGAGALVTVLPDWDGKNSDEVASAVCPNGGSVSQWGATEQKWLFPPKLAFGETVRFVARQNTTCVTRG